MHCCSCMKLDQPEYVCFCLYRPFAESQSLCGHCHHHSIHPSVKQSISLTTIVCIQSPTHPPIHSLAHSFSRAACLDQASTNAFSSAGLPYWQHTYNQLMDSVVQLAIQNKADSAFRWAGPVGLDVLALKPHKPPQHVLQHCQHATQDIFNSCWMLPCQRPIANENEQWAHTHSCGCVGAAVCHWVHIAYR